MADPEHIKKLVQQYEDMIADARKQGKNVAADNLQHWLDGTGTERKLEVDWLRGFSEVTDAEATNRDRFINKTISLQALSIPDGFSTLKKDFWDSKLTGSITEELYYASGTSTITSRGNFALARHGDWVHVVGMVEHHWWDPYDWHANLSAWIPGHGSISDADALELEKAGHGKAFGMYSFWSQTLEGKYGIDTGFAWFDQQKFTWSDVAEGRATGRVGHHHQFVHSAGVWSADHDAVTDRARNPLPGINTP